MSVLLCDECATVKTGQTTVGNLMDEGFALFKEGVRSDASKRLQALDKYYEALKVLVQVVIRIVSAI